MYKIPGPAVVMSHSHLNSSSPELQDFTLFTTGIALLGSEASHALQDDLLVFVFIVSHALFSPPLLPVSVGSDFWTDTEKSLFSAALGTYGKEFSLIQKMVYPLSMHCLFFILYCFNGSPLSAFLL